MSFLGLGGKSNQASVSTSAKLEAAETELDMVTDMFNRLVDGCHKKCISNYSDGELSKNEALCLDRCVAKYFDVNTKIGEEMQKMGSNFMGAR